MDALHVKNLGQEKKKSIHCVIGARNLEAENLQHPNIQKDFKSHLDRSRRPN